MVLISTSAMCGWSPPWSNGCNYSNKSEKKHGFMSELYYVPGWILGKIPLFTNNLVYSKSTDCYRLAWQQQADNSLSYSLSSIINLYRLILRFQETPPSKRLITPVKTVTSDRRVSQSVI